MSPGARTPENTSYYFTSRRNLLLLLCASSTGFMSKNNTIYYDDCSRNHPLIPIVIKKSKKPKPAAPLRSAKISTLNQKGTIIYYIFLQKARTFLHFLHPRTFAPPGDPEIGGSRSLPSTKHEICVENQATVL